MTVAEQSREQRRQELEIELRRAVEVLSKIAGVQRIMVFGAMARGETGAHSDLDLLVVMRSDRPFLDRVGDLYAVLAPRVETDLLAYTEDELRELSQRSFVRRILAEGKTIYAAAA